MQLTTPVCKLYGNRRSLSCIPRKNGKEVEASFSSSSSSSSSPPLDPDAPSSHKASPGDKFYHAPLGGVGAGGRDSDDDAFDLSSNPPATRPGDGESADSEAEYGQDRVKEEDEPGRLRGDFEAEEEMKLAVEEVEKELAGAGAGAGRGGVMIPDERRRRRWIVDEEEYERVLTERKTELGSRSVGTWRRQSGVQLKVQAWEACPKVLKAEKADFFEYIVRRFLSFSLSIPSIADVVISLVCTSTLSPCSYRLVPTPYVMSTLHHLPHPPSMPRPQFFLRCVLPPPSLPLLPIITHPALQPLLRRPLPLRPRLPPTRPRPPTIRQTRGEDYAD